MLLNRRIGISVSGSQDGGWTDDGTTVRLTTSTDDVIIGANTGSGAPFEVVGDSPGLVGGFAAGAVVIRSPSTDINANAVITGYNSFGGFKALWYHGSASSSNDVLTSLNRQNADYQLGTNNNVEFIIRPGGDLVFSNYPNTRDDGTLVNILGTDASGNLLSGPNMVVHIGGNFVDTNDQTISTINTPQDVTFDTNKLIDDISHTAGSATFTINTDGVYKLLWAPQLAQGSGSATVEFAVFKNGVLIADSGVQETISANAESLPLVRWIEKFVAGDTYKLKWSSSSLNTKLDNITSTMGLGNIPSIMHGVTHIGD